MEYLTEQETKMFGSRLRRCRNAKKMSEFELAERAGYQSEATVRRAEKPEAGQMMSQKKANEKAIRFGKALGILPDYLLGRVNYRTEREAWAKSLSSSHDAVQATELLLGCSGYVVSMWQTAAESTVTNTKPARPARSKTVEKERKKAVQRLKEQSPDGRLENVQFVEVEEIDPTGVSDVIHYGIEKSGVMIGEITIDQLNELADKVKDYCLFELKHMVDLRQPEKANDEEDETNGKT